MLSEDLLLAKFLQKFLKILFIPATFILLLLVFTMGTTCFWISNFLIGDQYLFFIKRNPSKMVILVIYMFSWLFKLNEAGKTGNVLDISVTSYCKIPNSVLEKQIYSHCEFSEASMESTDLKSKARTVFSPHTHHSTTLLPINTFIRAPQNRQRKACPAN